MRYHGAVIQPPYECNSFMLQVAHGCSLNHCTFYGTCLEKPFHYRKFNEILVDIALAQQMMPATRRVFLANGDALVF
jgi:hypothetical protein